MNTPFLTGITGGSASGKTVFLKALIDKLPADSVCLLSQDNYYRTKEEQPIDSNGVANFDTPQSIDFDAFRRDIYALRNGQDVSRQEYTFNNSAMKPKQLTFKAAPLVIVEGIFVFYEKEIRDLFDLKLFIDSREHIKLKRRIVRDKYERGYDMEDVLYRYEHHVAPTYEKYIEPYKSQADMVINNNSGFDKALGLVLAYLKNKI